MLETLRRSIGMQLARLHFRSSKEKVISFRQSVASAHSALVILPLASSSGEEEVSLLAPLRTHFSERNITVLASGPPQQIERALPRATVLRITSADITAFFLPRHGVIDRVREHTYDVAVDLNLDFMLPSAYICRESNARVRVGLAGPHADAFFNFQVRLDSAVQHGHAYERLLKCFQMFFPAEGA